MIVFIKEKDRLEERNSFLFCIANEKHTINKKQNL